MRVRSITIGTSINYPLDAGVFQKIRAFQRDARARFEEAGLEVQTVRIATQPFPSILRTRGPSEAPRLAQALESTCRSHGVDYCSIGPARSTGSADDLPYIGVIPEVIRRTDTVFASVLVATQSAGISLEAISRCADVIDEIARSTPNGFGNLRLAVLANCGPGSPFFPVSYHEGVRTSFSIATEAADLAVEAFSAAGSLEAARINLRKSIEESARLIQDVSRGLAASFGFHFGGIDFSLAPYPETGRSIGHAIERLGVDAFGSNGTLFAVALIKQAIQRADFPRCGFSGVMLPVLEDQTLALRSAEHFYSLDSLLLYSTVCGTGLDTIPLPGDVTRDELAAVLLDVATLSLVVDKPLTARLMPIPGKAVGDVTDFDFAYFANARIMRIRGRGASKVFAGNEFVQFGS
jgi:uncharacterized protein (UPF0210 family)